MQKDLWTENDRNFCSADILDLYLLICKSYLKYIFQWEIKNDPYEFVQGKAQYEIFVEIRIMELGIQQNSLRFDY